MEFLTDIDKLDQQNCLNAFKNTLQKSKFSDLKSSYGAY